VDGVLPENIAQIAAHFSERTGETVWPIGLDVPLLDFHKKIGSTSGIPNEGIQFTDRDPSCKDVPPLLYLSVFFKTSRLFGEYLPPSNEKWLYLKADVRPAFSLRIQVCANSDQDVDKLMWFLSSEDKYLPNFVRDAKDFYREQLVRDRQRGWSLSGPRPQGRKQEAGDYFRVWQEDGENRLTISSYTPTNAAMSIHARFSDEVAREFARYLEKVGFTRPWLAGR
jgi:hypothetical protein